jgi:hypothetical protein
VIVPVLETLRTQGLAPTGPLLERRRACCSTREYLVTILQTFRVSMIANQAMLSDYQFSSARRIASHKPRRVVHYGVCMSSLEQPCLGGMRRMLIRN